LTFTRCGREKIRFRRDQRACLRIDPSLDDRCWCAIRAKWHDDEPPACGTCIAGENGAWRTAGRRGLHRDKRGERIFP